MNKIAIIVIIFLLISSASFAEEDLINILFMEGKTEEVIIKSKKLLKTEPNNALNNFALGAALEIKEQFSNAVPYLENAVKYSKNNDFIEEIALSHLGTSYYGVGRYNESKASFIKVLGKSNNKNMLAYSLKYSKLFGLSDDYINWNQITSKHFIFHFQPKTKVKNIKKFIDDREKAFAVINSFFMVKNFPKKIDFFVWNSDEDSKKIINLYPGFSKPEYCLTHSYYDQTTGHEMTHIIANFTGSQFIKTPFITEGIAVYFDQNINDKATLAKKTIKKWRQSHSLNKLNLKDLWQKNWEEWQSIDIYFITNPMVAGFIGLLIEKKGREKFLELYENQTYVNALKIYGEKELIRLMNEYESYIYD